MTSVTVAPTAVTVVPDSTLNMVAIVTAVGGASEAVTWGVDTTSATAGVTISGSGVLTIPADISGTITVTATSVFDNSISGTASVSVVSVEQASIDFEGYLDTSDNKCLTITGLESSDNIAVEVIGAYWEHLNALLIGTWVELPVTMQSAGVYSIGTSGTPTAVITVPSGSGRNITTDSETLDCIVYFRITINGTETVTMGYDF